MATVTRGAVTLNPALIQGWELAAESRTIVHELIGTDDFELTLVPPSTPGGDLRLLFDNFADAEAAAAELRTPGGSWAFLAPPASLTAYVTGTVTLAAVDDEGTAWRVTARVREVPA